MGEPPSRSPESVILALFDRSPREPYTAPEIADETGYTLQTVTDTLRTLTERDLLRAKASAGDDASASAGGRVWWRVRCDCEAGERPGESVGETPGHERPGDARRLLEQHRRLAQLVTRVDVADDLDEILRLITGEARELVGAHQAATSRTVDQDWARAINAVSLSEKYAGHRGCDTLPDRSSLYSLVCQDNQSVRMTQTELEAHPVCDAAEASSEHPSLRGWLAVPIVGRDGENIGLIQLSDKYRGEFTEADEAILLQLANVASAAIENARLYDELRESEQRYRTLFESMTEGYCLIEQIETGPEEPNDFRYVETNTAFEKHTGLQDVAGRTVREVGPGEPRKWTVVYESVAETGEVVTFERRLGTERRVLQCQAFPIGDTPDGQVGATVRDVTERVERERRLKESNQRLEQFAHAASHDLQEPLRMVSSYLQLLERRYGDDLAQDGREFIDYAVDGADRMRAMIDGLLQYSRVKSGGDPFEPVDLDAVLADACDDLQVKIEECDAEITADELPVVEGDANQLRQVFQNLLDNAIEYSDDVPPDVRVTADRRETQGGDRADAEHETGDRSGSGRQQERGTGDPECVEWVVSVQDDGIGIDPAHVDRVFQVFERLHTHDEHPGTGIGLALCERIVERHGGEIWVESSPGEGSTFSFTLLAGDAED